MIHRRVGVAIACLIAWGPLRAQSPTASPVAAADTVTADRTQPLQPGDVVRVRIWREPDLSGDFPVPIDGFVNFPKAGRIRVAGESPAVVRHALETAYNRSLRDPAVEVTFLRRVNVLGSVRQPGLYPVDPTMTVMDALALAGGIQADGKLDDIEIRREGRTLLTNVSQAATVERLQLQSGDQIYVPQRSWWDRNSAGLLGAAITASASLLITLLTR